MAMHEICETPRPARALYHALTCSLCNQGSGELVLLDEVTWTTCRRCRARIAPTVWDDLETARADALLGTHPATTAAGERLIAWLERAAPGPVRDLVRVSLNTTAECAVAARVDRRNHQ